MLRPICKLVLCLLLLFAATLTLVRAQPSPGDDLRTLVDSTCAAPCFMDPQPGVTGISAALTTLQAHPWVGGLHYARGMAQDSGLVTWTWSGAQPTFFNAAVDGKLWLQDGRVLWIEVATRFRFGDLWLLGIPRGGQVSAEAVVPRRVSQEVIYNRLSARTEVLCPLLPSAFWRARLVLRLSDSPAPKDAYTLPRWRGCG